MAAVTTTPSVASIASTAESVLQGVMKVEPTIASIASVFVPGAAPIVAMVQPEIMLAIPFIDNALKALIAGNGGDAFTSFIQLLEHLTPGQPNSPALAAPAPTPSPIPDMPPPPAGT